MFDLGVHEMDTSLIWVYAQWYNFDLGVGKNQWISSIDALC
jgi:hypothetical protein